MSDGITDYFRRHPEEDVSPTLMRSHLFRDGTITIPKGVPGLTDEVKIPLRYGVHVPVIKDSGERRDFGTGAVRDVATGKGRFDLLDAYAIAALAEHMERGCDKYGDRNWENGIPQSCFADSAMRHMNRVMQGLDDEDHLLAAFWNLHCLVAQRERMRRGIWPTEKNGVQLDDLPVLAIPSSGR